MEIFIYVGVGGIGLVVGLIIGRYLLTQIYAGLEETARTKAAAIIKDAERQAETIRKEKLLEVQAIQNENKAKLEQEFLERNNKLQAAENRIKQKETVLNQKIESLKKEQQNHEQAKQQLAKQREIADKKYEELEQLRQDQVRQLEKIAGLTAEEARNKMMEQIVDQARAMAAIQVKEVIEQARLTANKEAKRIVIQTIQRTAAEHAIENAVTVFNLESDEIKGRIIGREGRNIRAIESATGVEIIVDDTPEAIVISGFDPIRREVARLSLHRLVQDGRIHPARIEEVVQKTHKQLQDEIMEIGERTAIDLGIHGLHSELIRHIGRMKYRSSYGQNLLQHSREVANLCAIMAAELGLNVKHARRAGLLHDIGKVVEDQPEQPHALLGMELAMRCKEHPDVCNAIGAHHDEIEMTALISPIVQACDAISGARPGARREVMESYIKRLKDMESLAQSYPGVTKTFAVQAGRELRVIVEAEKVTDEQADMLAFQISDKIQSTMQYPGQIKVTVIREKRAVAFAK
jgi:ribonuclease Y